jgi:Flp pilus assembly protein TadG
MTEAEMRDDIDDGCRTAAPREGVSPFMRRFAADESGLFIILFAISFAAMALAAAIAIDFARISLERTEMQRAVDAAALAAAHRLGMPDEAETGPAAAMAFYKANVPAGSPLVIEELKLNAATGEVVISSGGSIATSFLSAFGIFNVNVGAGARVVRGDGTVEVALVLDNSGSMAGGPIDDLKTAARNLVDVVFAGAAGNDKVRIGIVPFAGSVNVGAQRRDEGWIDTDGLSPVHHENFAEPRSRFALFDQLGTPWRGCVEARPGPHDVTDTTPTSADPATLFVPMLAPDEPDSVNAGGATYPNNYLNDFGGSCPVPEQVCIDYNTRRNRCDEYGPAPLTRAVAQARMCKYDGVSPPSGLGPNYNCTSAPLLDLTTYKADVVSAIDGMVANGFTNIGEGLMWGWRLLSPGAPFTQGRPWNDPQNQKVIVLMTDGENTYSRYSSNHNWTFYGAFGYAAKGRLGGTNSSTAILNQMNAKTRTACVNAKESGVIVYTIAFRLESNAATRALLAECATDSSKAFTASDGAALYNTFQAIGREISQLRVAS